MVVTKVVEYWCKEAIYISESIVLNQIELVDVPKITNFKIKNTNICIVSLLTRYNWKISNIGLFS